MDPAVQAIVGDGQKRAEWRGLTAHERQVARRRSRREAERQAARKRVTVEMDPRVVALVREVAERDERGRVRSMRWLDLGISDDQLAALAQGLTEGKPLAQTAWVGQGNPMSRASFDRVRDELIRRGLARWVNPSARAQGVELTPAGRGIMRKVVEQIRT